MAIEIPDENSDFFFLRESLFTKELNSLRNSLVDRILGYLGALPDAAFIGASSQTLVKDSLEPIPFEVPAIDLNAIQIHKYEYLPHDIYMLWRLHNRSPHSGERRRAIEVVIPYHGDKYWFRAAPILGLPQSPLSALIENEDIRLLFDTTENPDEDWLRQQIRSQVEEIGRCLTTLKTSVDGYRAEIEAIATDAVRERVRKIESYNATLDNLGYPIKQRENSLLVFANNRIERPILKPEVIDIQVETVRKPALMADDYEHILQVMQNMARVMEKCPKAFEKMEEEHLRFHILVQLNGHFKGASSAEAFNYRGKTDILVQWDGDTVFVAECKFWGGPQQLHDTIDQLFKYLTWRDTKAAIVIFSRNAGFSAVLGAIREHSPKHPQFRHALGENNGSVMRYEFANPSDPKQLIALTVLVFDVVNRRQTG